MRPVSFDRASKPARGRLSTPPEAYSALQKYKLELILPREDVRSRQRLCLILLCALECGTRADIYTVTCRRAMRFFIGTINFKRKENEFGGTGTT